MPDDYQQTLIEQHRRIESLLAHPPKQGFWHINAGHVITVLTLLVGGINLFAKLDNRVSNLEDRQMQIWARVQAMDDKGTHGSQTTLERISTNLSWLMRNVETTKANGSDPKP